MFHNARLQLTAWYLLMIMFISLIFSVVIYANVDRELVRFEKFQELSRDRAAQYFGSYPGAEIPNTVDEQLINEARGRLLSDLVILNVCILIAAGVAGYFLAGRTLTPIRKMIEDQSRFFGDASHELKTPITSLKSEIEIYLRLKKKSLKDADEVLKSNLEEVNRMQDLTNNLLTLATLEKAGQKLNFTQVFIREVLLEASKNVSAQAKKKKTSITIKGQNISFSGNQNSLIQLFTILFDNAIKYSKDSSKIVASAQKTNGFVSIKVVDNGIGIPEDEIENIFDRFYRVDKSRTSGDAGGFGLGLSIAKEIVLLHGGEIQVKSSSSGSTFTIDIPSA